MTNTDRDRPLWTKGKAITTREREREGGREREREREKERKSIHTTS